MVNDSELVEKACQGNLDAFGLIVGKYSNALYSVAYHILGDFHMAQDMAQEAFIKAYLNLHLLKTPEKLGGWLYSIVSRLSLNSLRRKKSELPLESIQDLNDYGRLEDTVILRDTQARVREALQGLGEHNRLAVVLYFISGFTMREIADFLNISVRAVESRIRRSKQQLKKELFHMVEDILQHNQLSRPFEETVILEIIPRIASIEIPVSNMDKAIAWYEEIIGAKAGFRDTEQGTAMLHLNNGAGAVGVPSLYLVETDDTTRLSFFNTLYGYEQSIIDFYTTDLAKFYTFLKENNIAVPEIDFDKEERSGFGFHDPDGNSLGVCSVTHEGQQGEDRVDGAWIERIATVEIPVSHLQSAEDWYCKCFGMKIKQREDNEWSLLHLQGDGRTGVPTIFLVQTDAEQRLTFQNTKTSINHSIIDFYSPDLHKFHRYLSGLGVRVTGFNPLDGGELGGFGITDPDGNLLAACNFVNKGQSQPSQDK